MWKKKEKKARSKSPTKASFMFSLLLGLWGFKNGGNRGLSAYIQGKGCHICQGRGLKWCSRFPCGRCSHPGGHIREGGRGSSFFPLVCERRSWNKPVLFGLPLKPKKTSEPNKQNSAKVQADVLFPTNRGRRKIIFVCFGVKFCFVFTFETGSHHDFCGTCCVDRAGLQLGEIGLLLPLECWDRRCVPPGICLCKCILETSWLSPGGHQRTSRLETVKWHAGERGVRGPDVLFFSSSSSFFVS